MTVRKSPRALVSKVRAVCGAQHVPLAYLFGSHARGVVDTESDIDLAVLAAPQLSKEERHRLRLDLTRTLAEALQVPLERIDVVVLQDVPVLLQYNVIRTGRVLTASDQSLRRAYEVDVERRYEDDRPLLEQETELTLTRILSRHP